MGKGQFLNLVRQYARASARNRTDYGGLVGAAVGRLVASATRDGKSDTEVEALRDWANEVVAREYTGVAVEKGRAKRSF